MRNIKFNYGFKYFSDPRLVVFTNTVIANLSTHFPTVQGLADLINAYDAFVTSVAISKNGSKVAKMRKNNNRNLLLEQHYIVMPGVLSLCANDRLKAIQSGYLVTKLRTPAPAVTMPQGLRTENGNGRGDLWFMGNRIPGAKMYVHEITPEPLTDNSEWQQVISTRCKHLFTKLTSGKRYYARMAAVGINGQKVYSVTILSKYVQ